MHIHWHEGLFLLPHHLQIFQRQIGRNMAMERQLGNAYSYGVLESEISLEDLENHRLRFSRLHCIFPSGRRVSFPGDGEISIRSFQKELQEKGELEVLVGIPLWKEDRANTLLEKEPGMEQAKLLYRVVESEHFDENTGSNPKAVLERKIHGRILFGGEEQSDLEVLSILRVTREVGEELGRPKQDTGFVGPCLLLGGSTILRETARSIAGQVEASRQELAVQINRGGFSLETMRGIQFEQLLRLQSLNRATARMKLMIATPSVSPLLFYVELIELLADLSALHPERETADFPPFDHDRPLYSYQQVIERLKILLRGAVSSKFERIPFILKEGLLRAELTEDHFERHGGWFLGISTKDDPVQLARLVQNEDRFKLMPPSLAARAVRGVVLQEERFPPLELPAQNGLYYFRLRQEESPELWEMVRGEAGLAVRWSGHDGADFQISLFLTQGQDS